MTNVELEVINYNIPNIEETSDKLIAFFAIHSDIQGTTKWLFDDLLKLRDDIREQKQRGRTLRAEGLELSFSGFLKPIPSIQDDQILLSARPPRFIIEEKLGELRPKARTHIQNVTEAIALEMNEVYHLEVKNPPMTLIFPNEVYTNSVEKILVENMPLWEKP